jgi:copper chaperone CopZ
MKQIILIIILAISIAACTSRQTPKGNDLPIVKVDAKLKVEGMTCNECEASIAKGVNELAGIDSINANHEDSTAYVRFDPKKTNLKEISKAIEKRGFHVVSSIK